MFFDAARNPTTKQQFLRVWGQTAAAPFETITSVVGGASFGVFRHLRNLNNAESENAQLRQQLDQMQVEMYNARAARDENERLKALLARDDYDPDEGAAYVNEVMAEDDANDPLLDSYQKYGKTP